MVAFGFTGTASITPQRATMPNLKRKHHPDTLPTAIGVRDSRQTAVGKEGIAGDVGGHIQACRHGGTCERFNLFPQNSNFNNSAYRRWENEITRALQNGDDVGNVTVRLNRADPYYPRPDSIEIEYQINGRTFTRDFENQAGGGQ